MDSIYTKNILEHNKRELDSPNAVERGHNPNCGDDLTLQMFVDKGRIVDAAYIGSGCAISQASMFIMIDLVKGLEVEVAKKLADVFLRMVRGESVNDEEKEFWEDASIFECLKKMLARVKCGTISFEPLI